jgi:NAD(P)-dependent dehydrogenase (short-subunit alcohol dehydrogenase family)
MTLSHDQISGLLIGMLQLFGAFYTARCAARAFIKLGIKGAIVFTASMASYRPNKVRKADFLGIYLPFYWPFASHV